MRRAQVSLLLTKVYSVRLAVLVFISLNICYPLPMRLLAALGLALILASPVSAEDASKLRAEQLDKLFGSLHQTTATENPDKIIADIWSIWEYDAAEKMLIQLIEVYPDYAEAWNKRATLYFMQGRYDASLIDIEHVLELEPRHFGALGGKAMILRAQGKTVEALKVLKETLAINPHADSVAQAIKDLLKTSPDI
jgi:tetratricopeptide (TPR) repeat protein